MLRVTIANIPEGVLLHNPGFNLSAILQAIREYCVSCQELHLAEEDIDIAPVYNPDSNIDLSGKSPYRTPSIPVLITVEQLDDRTWSESQRDAFVQGLLGAVLPRLHVPGCEGLHALVVLHLFNRDRDATAAA